MGRVFVIANDVVPGSAMPVAAPGLRAHGLVAGLLANGVPATLVVPTGQGRSPWRSPLPRPSQPFTAVVRPVDLRDFLTTRAPATVLITNSNQIDRVEGIEGIALVFDMFAPKMLELSCGQPPPSPAALDRLAERKRRALQASSGYVVNGAKKLPYLADWLSDSAVDPTNVPVALAEMALPSTVSSSSPARNGGPLQLLIAGYVQNWSRPGRWLEQVGERLSEAVLLDVMLPSHWGGGARQRAATADLSIFEGHPSVARADSMPFERFRHFVASHHVAIDLFDETAERRLAMVTRTVTALASGTPVIHPPFTEVSPLIESYDAGWLVDPADSSTLARVLDEIIDDREAVDAKTANTARLWADHFDPAVAARPLVELLEGLTQP